MSSNSVTYQEYTQRLRRADMYSIVKDQMIELGIGKTGTELYEILSNNSLIDEGERVLYKPDLHIPHMYKATPMSEKVLNCS